MCASSEDNGTLASFFYPDSGFDWDLTFISLQIGALNSASWWSINIDEWIINHLLKPEEVTNNTKPSLSIMKNKQ